MKETARCASLPAAGGFADGEQRRDFVYVRDLCRMNMFFAQIGPMRQGRRGAHCLSRVVKRRLGLSRSFNDVAVRYAVHGEAAIE